MPRRIDIRPQAYVDLAEISDYIAHDRPSSAKRFLLAAERTFAWLAAHSDLGMPCGFEHSLVADVRWWRVKGFKSYLIFYRQIERGIQVVRVLHGARDIEVIFEVSKQNE